MFLVQGFFSVGSHLRQLNVKQYYNSSIRVLDLVYLERRTIYNHLFEVTFGNSGPAKEEDRYFLHDDDIRRPLWKGSIIHVFCF